MLHADFTLLLHTHQGADGACLLLSTACLLFVCRLLAIVYRLLAFVYCLLAIVYRLLATVYRLPLTPCYYYPLPACLLLALTRLLAIVDRLPALLAGAALVIAHACVADRIAYPYGVWDCLCYS